VQAEKTPEIARGDGPLYPALSTICYLSKLDVVVPHPSSYCR